MLERLATAPSVPNITETSPSQGQAWASTPSDVDPPALVTGSSSIPCDARSRGRWRGTPEAIDRKTKGTVARLVQGRNAHWMSPRVRDRVNASGNREDVRSAARANERTVAEATVP